MTKKSITMLTIILLISVTGLTFGQEIALHFRCSFLNEDGIRGTAHFNQIGVSAMTDGEYNIAISAYNCAIRSEEDYYAPYYNRGIAHRHLGNYDLALQDFYMAMDYASSSSEELYLNLAITYDLMDATSDALAYYSQYLNMARESETTAWVSARVDELYR